MVKTYLITGRVVCCLNIVIDRMRMIHMITWYVACCAKYHFHPFQFFSSITMPPSWKMLPVTKTPENSTLQAIFIKNGIESYFIILFHTISHFVVKTTKKYVSKKWDTYARIRYYTLFAKHLFTYFSNTHLLFQEIPFTISLQLSILCYYINIIILLPYCNYYNQ